MNFMTLFFYLGNICLIKLVGNNYNYIINEAIKIKEYLNNPNIIVLGPSPSIIPKIYNKYYIQLVIKYKII